MIHRYTEGANSIVYAMFLKWPLDGKIAKECVKHLGSKSTEIEFLGPSAKLKVRNRFWDC